MSIPIISFVGKSRSGKTTLIEKLIPVLKTFGYRVAAIKHHAHAGFEIDLPGKDTWRFAQAGSDWIVLASPDKIASIQRLKNELSLDEIVSSISGVDIILVEGFKRSGKPAFEVVRKETGLELISSPPQLIAIASDTTLDVQIPIFHLDDIPGIVNFIVTQLMSPADSKQLSR